MTIINPDVELLPISTSFDEMLNDIERAACICYGNNKSNLDTLKFLHALHIKNHNRPFEFGTLYINPDDLLSTENEDEIIDYILESHWTKTDYVNKTSVVYFNNKQLGSSNNSFFVFSGLENTEIPIKDFIIYDGIFDEETRTAIYNELIGGN